MSDTLETKYYRDPEGNRYRVRFYDDPEATYIYEEPCPHVSVVVEESVKYIRAHGQGPWDGHEHEPPLELWEWILIESVGGYDDMDFAREEALSWLPENIEEETD